MGFRVVVVGFRVWRPCLGCRFSVYFDAVGLPLLSRLEVEGSDTKDV